MRLEVTLNKKLLFEKNKHASNQLQKIVEF